MYKRIKICIIGNGNHSKRLQKVLKKNKIDYVIYKRINGDSHEKKNLEFLKNFKYIFIASPNITHVNYIKALHKHCFIFCEKPPTNNLKDLDILKKIKSDKIYFNYNYRFSKIAQILKNKKKYNLGKLIYINIISGHGLGLKKEYKKNWRSNKKKCPKGVFEMLSIHWIDLINQIFKITKFDKPYLNNLSGIGNSIDNSKIRLEIEKNIHADIFCSYTSPLINKKIFIFKNGSVEQNENKIQIKGPSLNFDKNNFLKQPKLIKSFKINEKKDYEQSLENSINFFFKSIKQKKFFSRTDFKKILKINSLII